jgi:hypothetical protein
MSKTRCVMPTKRDCSVLGSGLAPMRQPRGHRADPTCQVNMSPAQRHQISPAQPCMQRHNHDGPKVFVTAGEQSGFFGAAEDLLRQRFMQSGDLDHRRLTDALPPNRQREKVTQEPHLEVDRIGRTAGLIARRFVGLNHRRRDAIDGQAIKARGQRLISSGNRRPRLSGTRGRPSCTHVETDSSHTSACRPPLFVHTQIGGTEWARICLGCRRRSSLPHPDPAPGVIRAQEGARSLSEGAGEVGTLPPERGMDTEAAGGCLVNPEPILVHSIPGTLRDA